MTGSRPVAVVKAEPGVGVKVAMTRVLPVGHFFVGFQSTVTTPFTGCSPANTFSFDPFFTVTVTVPVAVGGVRLTVIVLALPLVNFAGASTVTVVVTGVGFGVGVGVGDGVGVGVGAGAVPVTETAVLRTAVAGPLAFVAATLTARNCPLSAATAT